MGKWITNIKSLVHSFKEDNATLLAAAQAYYYMLSIIPLLIVCFAVIPYLHLDTGIVLNFINNQLPSGLATAFHENIINIIEKPKGGLLTIGIITTLWSASNGVNAFIESTNEAYGVEETRGFFKVRMLAIGLTLTLVFAFVFVLILPVFGHVILKLIQPMIGISELFLWIFTGLRWIMSVVVVTLLLTFFYHYAPNKKIPFKHIIPGTSVASMLWLIISFGFSIYVSNFGNYSVTYGSLGGIIILMIWFFLTGLILIIGAEINVFYHQHQTQSSITARSEVAVSDEKNHHHGKKGSTILFSNHDKSIKKYKKPKNVKPSKVKPTSMRIIRKRAERARKRTEMRRETLA